MTSQARAVSVARSGLRDEIRAMWAPFAAYRDVLRRPLRVGWRALVTRPAWVALVIGAFVTLSNTGELLPTLWLGSLITWTWAPLLQMAIATPLIVVGRAIGGRRDLPLSSALDLFFLGHAPWSLWLMGTGALLATRLPDAALAGVLPILTAAIVPVAWTMVILFAFFRTVLALSLWAAALLTLLYQAALWGCVYLYIGAATYRLWPFSPYAGWLG
jgi:hypothetical protein